MRNSASPARKRRKKAPARAADSGRAASSLLFFLSLFLLDQVSKTFAARFLAPGGSRPILGPWLRLTYHENTGAAFGLFGGGVRYLAVFSWIFIAGLVWYLAAPRKTAPRDGSLSRGALVLILAGAAGNAVDRIRLGHVVDFIDLGFWPIFNVADSAITLGVAWLAASVIFSKKEST